MFNKFADKRLDEKTKLDEKVNLDNLIYRYKDKTTDAKFDEFDNAFNLLDKIRNGKTTLADVKSDKIQFKSDLGKIKKRHKKQIKRVKKEHCTILKYFTKQGTVLLIFLMIILYQHLKLKIKLKSNQQKIKQQKIK